MGFAKAEIDGEVKQQCVAGFAEATRDYVARGDVYVGETKIPFVAKGDLAKELAKVMVEDSVRLKGNIVAYDTSKMVHRGGFPFLEIEVTEIVEWRKQRKTF